MRACEVGMLYRVEGTYFPHRRHAASVLRYQQAAAMPGRPAEHEGSVMGMSDMDAEHSESFVKVLCETCRTEITDEQAADGVVHMAGAYWHIQCFTCITCGRQVPFERDNVLLVGSQPMCGGCTFNCTACGEPITDEVVLCGASILLIGTDRTQTRIRIIQGASDARCAKTLSTRRHFRLSTGGSVACIASSIQRRHSWRKSRRLRSRHPVVPRMPRQNPAARLRQW